MISWAAEVDSWKVVDEAGAVVDLEVESGLRAFLGGAGRAVWMSVVGGETRLTR